MSEEVMEQVKKELDDLLTALGKANCPLSNSVIRQVLIKTILEIPELLIKDPDQSLPSVTYASDDPLYDVAFQKGIAKEQERMLKENWVKVIKEKSNE